MKSHSIVLRNVVWPLIISLTFLAASSSASVFKIITSYRFNSINNGGDAGNRNPRKPSLNIPSGFNRPFRNSSSAFNVPPIPQFPDERSRGRTKSVPKFYGTVQQLRFVDALISKYLAHAKPSPLKAWMSMQIGLRSSENFHRFLLTGTSATEDQRTSKAIAQAAGNPSRNRHICRRCYERQPAAHPVIHLAHRQ